MPQLVVDSGPAKGTRLRIPTSESVVVGRDSRNDFPLKDPLVSRKHFRLSVTSDTIEIEDLASVNGTFVNGKRVAGRSALTDGDRIQAGETLLTYFAEEAFDPLIGQTISGFEVLERIGSGGMGAVYKARQLSLDRFVALKVLSRELAANRRFTELFHREARAAGQINHPSIVQVYDVDTVPVDGDDVTFFAMEYMSGGSVEDLLAREGKLDVLEAVRITLETARGLAFAEQRGLVHRDIKPGNLMFSEGGMVKIGDLGIARSAEAGKKVSQKDGISGSPHYIAPEQAQGKVIDTGADIYSLGVSLFHMLAGRPPFVGSSAKELVLKHVREEVPSVRDLRADVPVEVSDVLAHMTRKDRDERHATAAELVEELDDLYRHLLARQSQAGLGARLGHSIYRSLPVLASLILVGILGTAGTVLYLHVQQTRRDAQILLAGYRTELEERLTDVELLLEDGALVAAREGFDEHVRPELAGDNPHADEVEEMLARARGLEARLIAAETEVAEQKRLREARDELTKLLATKPEDLDAHANLAAVRGLAEHLEQFVAEHAGTPAAERARAERKVLEAAAERVERRLRAARYAFNSVSNTVRSFLSLDPPNFKEALGALREFQEEHPDTPEVDRAQAHLREVVKEMLEEVRQRGKAAREASGRAERAAAVRRLESLRPGLEGAALEQLEEFLEEVRAES